MGNVASCVGGTRSDQVTMTSCAVDTEITIGTSGDSEPITYNVSQFFRDYSKIPSDWHKRLDQFFTQLDNRTQLNLENPTYKPVKYALDEFVDNLCEKLAEKSGIFDKITKKRTGSLFAGLRVGLPVEGDFLLKMRSKAEIRKCIGTTQQQTDLLKVFYDDIKVITNDMKGNWILNGIKKHRVGVCLNLEYRERKHMPTIPVLLDVIPVTPVSKFSKRVYTSTEEAREYIQSRNSKDLRVKYQLLSASDTIIQDTAYAQHKLLRKVPSHIKSSLRVAKYLLQSQLVSPTPCVDTPLSNYGTLSLDKRTSIQNYGYAPMVRSHIVQVLLIHLLVSTHGTVDQEQITGAGLTLCLIDMLYTVCQKIGTYSSIMCKDPIFQNREEQIKIFNCTREDILSALQNLTCSLLCHAKMGTEALEFYPLLNSNTRSIPTTENIRPEVRFTGFCRGSSLDQFANAHNCIEHGCPLEDSDTFRQSRSGNRTLNPNNKTDSWTSENFLDFKATGDPHTTDKAPADHIDHSYINMLGTPGDTAYANTRTGCKAAAPKDVHLTFPVSKDGYLPMNNKKTKTS